MVPIVLPPIYDKSRHYGNLLQPVWDQAAQELRYARRAIVFGYSFPEADVRARGLFLASWRKNDHLREIVVINPDTSVVAKVARLVSNVPIRYCKDVPEFLEGNG
jgi:hypothetical protein